MSKLLNKTLRQFLLYAAIVLIVSVPVYYALISRLWQYEFAEHNIVLTDDAGQEDTYLIIGSVTILTMVFFLLMMLGFIFINRRISKKLWKPFYFSLSKIKNFKLDHQSEVKFDKPDIDEFLELNQSLERLISGNIASYRQQKEFAENASHELQTPLSIVQLKLELLSQSPTLKDEHYMIIEDALKALARVSRINKNLLLLTKIENSQYMDEESLNLSDLLKTNLELFAPFFEDKRLTLSLDVVRKVHLKANKILLEILINNLVTNAIRYSVSGDSIGISLDQMSLTIENSGSVPLNRDRLFKRFSTGSNESPGTGLGLALVQEIAARYKWSVGYDFINGRHVFTISLS